MTASVHQPAVVDPAPVQAPVSDTPLSLQAADYRSALSAGAVAVDIRSHRKRQSDGALFGALAIAPTDILELLTPGTPGALRSAVPGSRWVLISDDGHEAEWLAWHLQARGVTGAVFVVGGFRRLRAAGINGEISRSELAIYSAH